MCCGARQEPQPSDSEQTSPLSIVRLGCNGVVLLRCAPGTSTTPQCNTTLYLDTLTNGTGSLLCCPDRHILQQVTHDFFVSGDDMPDPRRRAVAHEQEQAPLADGIARRADVSPTRYAVAGTPCVRVVAKLLDAVTAGRQQPLQCVSAQRSCLWNMKRSLCSS